ncbi:hypothetical protein PG995_002878 [Apiospora arundinis]
MASASPHQQNIHGITAGPNAMVLAGTFHGCSFDHDDIATRRTKVLDDLRLTDPLDDRAELQSQKGRRLQGTCLWIQDHPDYRSWLQGDCAQLWISGGPGMGKTMLSIFITESLEDDSKRVAYFFCRHDDEKRNTETAVLRGLLVRLLQVISEESFNQHVWPSFHSGKAASYTLSRPQAIWNVFEALVTSQDSAPTFCILDGLDECDKESSRNLTRRFHDLFTMNKTMNSFKLAVVSRDQSGLRGFSNLRLQECDLHIRHDIELYIASNIRDSLSHKTGLNGWTQWISDKLRHRSEGSFLWINFVIRDLSRYRTSSEVIKALERTPKGLEEQYRRILHRIFEEHDEDWQEIQALLAWAALAFVPLTLSQLVRAVMGSVTRKHRERIKDLCIYCEHLLVVNDKTGVVRFVHTSVKEFLAQPHHIIPTNSVTGRTHVDDGHRIIMRTCLKILEQAAQSDVLKPYAVKFLPRHMKACTAADISRELSRPYFRAENILQRHWEEWRLQSHRPKVFPEATPSPLHIATYWGVMPWAQHQLQTRSIWDIVCRRSQLEFEDAYGLTPLAIAVREQNVPMVEWLLQQGAIVHLEVAIPEDAEKHVYGNARGKSPLVLAFDFDGPHDSLEDWLESRSMEIASLLLSHLNKPTWRSIRQSRAMAQVMDAQSQVLAQWLLDLFPPPPKVSRTHFKCQALAMAVRWCHFEICEQLLDCGADIYSSWEPGRNALADAIQAARSDDHLERMLNLLFDEYDKRIATSGVGHQRDILLQPIIHMSLCVEYYEYFRIYTESYTFINEHWSNIEEGQVNTLVIAVFHDQGLGICLKRGNFGRFSDSGYSGRFELIGAIMSGQVEQVRVLLRHGAKVNTVDRHGNSILTLAMQCAKWEMADVLLSHGAEFNFVGRTGTTPLIEAVRAKTMRPSVDSNDEISRNNLLPSLRKTKLKTVATLLESGASTHWRTLAGETALSLAANLADAVTVNILVERGARIMIEDQIWYRGLWRWFIIFKILRMCGRLSSRRCSKLLADRLQLLTKTRSSAPSSANPLPLPPASCMIHNHSSCVTVGGKHAEISHRD